MTLKEAVMGGNKTGKVIVEKNATNETDVKMRRKQVITEKAGG